MDKEKLKQHHADELRDVELYHHMAEEYPDWESVFRSMARDEQSHADMIEYMLLHG